MDSIFFLSSSLDSNRDNVAVLKENNSGNIEIINSFNGGIRPTYHCYNPEYNVLYLVNEMNHPMYGRSGSIRTYAIDLTDGSQKLVGEVDSGGEDPCFLILDTERKRLLCTNYSGSSLAVFEIKQDGSLSTILQLIQWKGKGLHPDRQSQSHPHSICFSPDGKFVFVPDLGCDQLRVLKWNSDGSVLIANDDHNVLLPAGSGPRMMSFVPESNVAWLVNELTSTADKLVYDGYSIILEKSILLTDHLLDHTENTASHLNCHKDYVLFSNRGLNNIVMYDGFDRHFFKGNGECPRFFLTDAEKGKLYVLWQDSSKIDIYNLDSKGTIYFEKTLLSFPMPTCLSLNKIQFKHE